MRNCQIFTPPEIVRKMLDMLGYTGDNIKTKTIFEPSFGGGAFLTQIVDRIFEYSESNHLTSEEIIAILDNIHGVELDKKWYDKTIELLTNKCAERGINYDWIKNLLCTDTTTMNISNQYDLCVGNPPLSINQQLCKKDRYTSINHKKQLHTYLYHGGVVVS